MNRRTVGGLFGKTGIDCDVATNGFDLLGITICCLVFTKVGSVCNKGGEAYSIEVAGIDNAFVGVANVVLPVVVVSLSDEVFSGFSITGGTSTLGAEDCTWVLFSAVDVGVFDILFSDVEAWLISTGNAVAVFVELLMSGRVGGTVNDG
jgi:hypothetical protein